MHKVDTMSQNTDFFNLGAYCFPTNSSIWVQGFNLAMLGLIPSTLHNIQVMSVSNSVHLIFNIQAHFLKSQSSINQCLRLNLIFNLQNTRRVPFIHISAITKRQTDISTRSTGGMTYKQSFFYGKTDQSGVVRQEWSSLVPCSIHSCAHRISHVPTSCTRFDHTVMHSKSMHLRRRLQGVCALLQ